MIKFDAVTLRRGPRILFAEASFSLFRGEKVGITGENGSGKSSLMALVQGHLQPDAGHFEMPTNLEVAHVAQELDATDQPAIAVRARWRCRAARSCRARIAAAEADHDHDGTRLATLYARVRQPAAAMTPARVPRS